MASERERIEGTIRRIALQYGASDDRAMDMASKVASEFLRIRSEVEAVSTPTPPEQDAGREEGGIFAADFVAQLTAGVLDPDRAVAVLKARLRTPQPSGDTGSEEREDDHNWSDRTIRSEKERHGAEWDPRNPPYPVGTLVSYYGVPHRVIDAGDQGARLAYRRELDPSREERRKYGHGKCVTCGTRYRAWQKRDGEVAVLFSETIAATPDEAERGEDPLRELLSEVVQRRNAGEVGVWVEPPTGEEEVLCGWYDDGRGICAPHVGVLTSTGRILKRDADGDDPWEVCAHEPVPLRASHPETTNDTQNKDDTMNITAQFTVHSRTDTENTVREYVLRPLGVEDVADDLEAVTDEEFDRLSDDVEGFRFGVASMIRIGGRTSLSSEVGIVIRTTDDLSPGDRVTLTLTRAAEGDD